MKCLLCLTIQCFIQSMDAGADIVARYAQKQHDNNEISPHTVDAASGEHKGFSVQLKDTDTRSPPRAESSPNSSNSITL